MPTWNELSIEPINLPDLIKAAEEGRVLIGSTKGSPSWPYPITRVRLPPKD